jgi:hypothetical protein
MAQVYPRGGENASEIFFLIFLDNVGIGAILRAWRLRMKITLKQLRKLGACSGQVDLFKATFGKEAELTEALVLEHGPKFDIHWLAGKIFTAPIYEEYFMARATIDAEYLKALDPIDAEYLKALYPIYEEYEKARATIFWKCVKMMED